MLRRLSLRTSRIEAFSDGVFSIVCTLLVLDLGVPHLQGLNASLELSALLVKLGPKIFCYIMSFCIIIIYWVAHYHLFHIIKKSDRGLLWLNSLFLMVLAFIPFPTALVGEYPNEPLAVMLFAGVMAMAGVCFTLMRWYVSLVGKLIDPGIDRALIKRSMLRSLANPVLYTTAIILAPYNTRASLVLCAAIPVLYFFPGKLEKNSS